MAVTLVARPSLDSRKGALTRTCKNLLGLLYTLAPSNVRDLTILSTRWQTMWKEIRYSFFTKHIARIAIKNLTEYKTKNWPKFTKKICFLFQIMWDILLILFRHVSTNLFFTFADTCFVAHQIRLFQHFTILYRSIVKEQINFWSLKDTRESKK